jgi:tRNA-dihydrouridine synthase 1
MQHVNSLLTTPLKAWRLLSRSFMPSNSPKDLLAYTPMLHARMVTETQQFRDKMFQPLRQGLRSAPDPSITYPPDKIYLDGNPAIDRPLFVQFCANEPDELFKAAEYVQPFCDAVDLNLGCPQGIARKGHYGAFLQEDQDLIYNLINKLHINLSVPVTAKIRILESKEKTLEYAKRVLDAGASIITVHGRQRDQKGHKTGLADWTVLRYLRDNLPPDTVMFANGNILRREDIDRCLEVTGADAVMSAEGNLHDPAIFGDAPPIGEEGREYWRGVDGKGGYRMDAVMRRYMDIIYQNVLEVSPPSRVPLFLPSDSPLPPQPIVEEQSIDNDSDQPPKKKQKRTSAKKERTTSPNLLAMQPHLFHLLRPLVSKHHNVRDALARCKAGDVPAFENVLQLVEAAVKEGLIEYEATGGQSVAEDDVTEGTEAIVGNGLAEEVPNNYESSVQTVRDCKRPWWVCQPYVRPLPAEALAKGSLHLSKKELKALSPEEKLRYDQKQLERADNFRKVKNVPAGEQGHTVVEHLGVRNGVEAVEVPKEGLVCG